MLVAILLLTTTSGIVKSNVVPNNMMRLNYNPENVMISNYNGDNAMNLNYAPSNVMRSNNKPDNMLSLNYAPNNAMSSNYNPDNAMSSNYAPNNVMRTNYNLDNVMGSNYAPNNVMRLYYNPDSVMSSNYAPNNVMRTNYNPDNVIRPKNIPHKVNISSAKSKKALRDSKEPSLFNFMSNKMLNLLNITKPDYSSKNKSEVLAIQANNTGPTTKKYPGRAFKVEGCDNVATYCFKSYTTGRVCGKTTPNHDQHQRYQTFKTHCELDYLNCAEGFNDNGTEPFVRESDSHLAGYFNLNKYMINNITIWTFAHMGACMDMKDYVPVKFFEYYEYWEDVFLDQVYVIRE